MDARLIRAALTAAVLLAACGANYRTPNFIVETPDPQLAEQFAKTAEQHRRELAIEWLGQAMPDWSQPCTITVQVGPHLGAGGATSFLFDRGEVFGWRMTIQGSAERVMDSVLPHEITHMIFASHFRTPVPRWADEGGATSVEHPTEQTRHRTMLVQFLRSGRGIALDQLFAMRDYPPDVMPLYAQSHSVANYLIQQGGRRKFITFVAEGMQAQDWAGAAERHYAIHDLGALQNQWVAWVGRGCPQIAPKEQSPGDLPHPGGMLADNRRLPRPASNLIFRVSGQQAAKAGASAASPTPGATAIAASVAPAATSYLGQVRTESTRPQPIEQPRQRVIQWGK